MTTDHATIPADELTDEQILQQFKDYESVGFIEYVLPTNPLGEEWILGIDGQICKLIGKGDATIFIAGAGMVLKTIARKKGLI